MQHLTHLLEVDSIVQDVWVRGELSNFTRASSGHLYFSLKDGDACVRCVMWRGQAAGVRRLPSEGDALRVHGHVGMYEVRGDLQLYVDELVLDGVGALWKKYEQLKAQLQSEGLFALERKRPLPPYPRCIGIVTSEKGAALQDMLRILRQRWPAVEVALCACQVQGMDAPAQIVRALRTLDGDDGVEVIIVARGGGSIEDLWAFNDEGVARAIFASRRPVVSGVGHEVDFTIADFVADLRAPTPTAAAALVVPDRAEAVREAHAHRARLWLAMDNLLTTRAEQARNLGRSLLRVSPQSGIARERQRIDERVRSLDKAVLARLRTLRERVHSRQRQLASLNPQAILARGYAIVRKDGHALSTVAQVAPGDRLLVRVSDGEFAATVNSEQ